MKSLVKWLLYSRNHNRCRRFLSPATCTKESFKMMSQRSRVESETCRVAVTQMTSVSDKEVNLSTCENLVKKAAAAGAQMVFLPEACDYIAESKEDSINMAESIHGPLVSKYRKLAASLGIWLSLGGLHIKEKEENKVSNTHLLIDDKGEIASTYKKTHLFSVHIPEKNLHLEESTYISKGEAIHPPVLTPVGNVALAICYDMRFPELSLIQRKLGAQILTFPSAFTVTTGLAHWEAILRGRAIETQCYVIAAAQSGQHNKKRSSYGHAMIVDPWGTVLNEISGGTDFAVADLDLNYLNKIRKDMPVMTHRRSDLYHICDISPPETPRLCDLLPMPTPYVSYQFGNVSVPGSCIFLKSRHSQAFVNKKPVVPGHVLVTPERPAKRLTDMKKTEICDLIQLTQIAVEVIIKEHEPETLQVAIQDGSAAGQTIEHVHIHVVPQSTASKEKLQGHEKNIKWRHTKEMEEEASKLRQVVIDNSSVLRNPLPCIFEPFEITVPTFPDGFRFGHLHIPEDFMIAKTKHSCTFVPPQPILHGHVCVASLQPSMNLREATADILTDLLLTVQVVQKHVLDICSSDTRSSTVIILQELQMDNNQHLQVHIIPRTEGDFPDNDDIYSAVTNVCGQSSCWSNTEQSRLLASAIRKAISAF